MTERTGLAPGERATHGPPRGPNVPSPPITGLSEPAETSAPAQCASEQDEGAMDRAPTVREEVNPC